MTIFQTPCISQSFLSEAFSLCKLYIQRRLVQCRLKCIIANMHFAHSLYIDYFYILVYSCIFVLECTHRAQEIIIMHAKCVTFIFHSAGKNLFKNRPNKEHIFNGECSTIVTTFSAGIGQINLYFRWYDKPSKCQSGSMDYTCQKLNMWKLI